MKYYFIIIGIFLSSTLLAQPADTLPRKGFAIIKGNVKNNTDDFFDIMQPGFFSNPIITVSIEKNGNFLKQIEFDENTQDLIFYLNEDAFVIYVERNDTIEINWDTKDFENALALRSNKSNRNEALQTLLTLYKLYRKPFLNLANLQKEKSSDSLKFVTINQLFNKEIKTLLNFRIQNNSLVNTKIATDIYYKYTNILSALNLFPAYELFYENLNDITEQIPFLRSKREYKNLTETGFKTSAEYRNFLFTYIRFHNNPFRSFSVEGTETKAKYSGSTPVWDDYYKGLANLKIYKIRDWFITKVIINGFGSYSFDEATAVYEDFLPKVKIRAFSDTLKSFYDNVQRLKPGKVAPEIILRDENGKLVSLSNFKGKAVYIDFWGVSCGPCIRDIKNYVPELHEKYKDKNIVFLNICVDTNEKKWKESLLKLNLHGVNLIAEGWTKHPVCQAYGVNSVPNYFLIDKEGKIVNNNAPSPSMKTTLHKELDKLLK